MQSYGIDNSQISASSETSVEKEKFGSHSARLNDKFAWRAKENASKGEYLQIDLGELKRVTAIATQGDTNASAWVTSFKVDYSSDSETWGNLDQIFRGNNEARNELLQLFHQPVITRYLKVLPQTWIGRIGMRIELYGCYPTCDSQPVGLQDGRITNSQMTASSTYLTKAYNGRLGFTQGDSWCAAMEDTKPFLEIDFGAPYVLCAVATQGNSKADQMVTSYTLQISNDGSTWTDVKDDGQIIIFEGNYDRSKISKSYFYHSHQCRYIRVLPQTFLNAPCMRIEFYGVERKTCDNSATGLAKPHFTVPDYRFTSTSSPNMALYAPWDARLLDTHCWEPATTTGDDYLQVDLGDPRLLCAVSLQPHGELAERTETYKMSFSMDGKTWKFYPEGQVLPGNTGPHWDYPTIHYDKNTFADVQIAKFVRIYPVAFNTWKCFRAELYGLKQAWKTSSGLETLDTLHKVTDIQIMASSSLDDDHVPGKARLYGEKTWCPVSASGSFLQFDLLTAKQVFGIAVQGDETDSHWVTEFDLEYGYTTSDLKSIKSIPTNLTNGKEVKVYWSATPIIARFIKILPTKWDGNPCMRIDLYESKRAKSVKITDFKVYGNMIAQSGSFITVNCSVSEIYDVDLKWFLGKNDVTENSKGLSIYLGKTSSELQVNFTSISDIKSTYTCKNFGDFQIKCTMPVTCRAEREFANGDRRDHLLEFVLDRELQIQSLQVVENVTSTSSSLVTIECAAIGDNAVTIKWLLDGHSLSDKTISSTYANDITSSQLQLNFTSISQDKFSLQKCQNIEGFQLKCAATVTCLATRAKANDVQKDYLIEATLARQLEIIQLESIVNDTSGNTTSVTIQCAVSGDNATSIQWQLGGRDVTSMSRNNTYVNGNISSQLQVTFASISDAMSNCDFTCEEAKSSQLRCIAKVSCQGLRHGFKAVNRERSVEVFLSAKKAPSTKGLHSIMLPIILTCSIIGFIILLVIGVLLGLCC